MKTLATGRYTFVLITTVLLLSNFDSRAQLKYQYHPRQTHSELSKGLIHELEGQFLQEDRNMPMDRVVRRVNYERRITFMEKVLNGAFIKDDSLETYVGNTLDNIVDNNSLQSYPRRVLILSSPHVNAVCYGQGIYAVTVGLLSRIENEDQLAFILAHELAHDELGHIRARIVHEADQDLEENTRRQTLKVIAGKVDQEEIEDFRGLLYGYCKHTRRNELRADSMAITLLRNAYYDAREAFSALTILHAPQSPKYDIGAALFAPFHSPENPFQDYWLNDRLTVYSKKYMNTFLYVADSIETHPSIAVRKEALSHYFPGQVQKRAGQSLELVKAITELAAFETVESAYKNKAYDLALYHALQLYDRYPANTYLASRIGKILTDLYEVKNLPKFETYVSKYTPNYCDELKLINSLLYNLTQDELGEIAFQFLKNDFKTSEKSHHYLLWKISSLTYRDNLIAKISDDYKSRFGANIQSYNYR